MADTVQISGRNAQTLAARIDRPGGAVKAWALFAHCFSCSKDVAAARTIARTLASKGIGVLRFDFTGLGHSDGDFADTNFSTNLSDLEDAANWLAENEMAPDLLIGHSLGGAAVVAVAGRLPSVKAVATIGAPSEADHVIHNFGSHLDEIEEMGEAQVDLAGRPFKIKKQFVEDVRGAKVKDAAANLKRPLLVMHAPSDEVVGIDNATGLFVSAKHPKSFVSLDDADHLLSKRADGIYAAEVIAGWASRYLPGLTAAPSSPPTAPADGVVRVTETGQGKYHNDVLVGAHRMIADEPVSLGGTDQGPTPYDYLKASLAACTSITLRMYTQRKGWDIGPITVDVTHEKTENAETGDKEDVFERNISVAGKVTDEQKAKLIEIADKCPVHKTLKSASQIRTVYGQDVI
ncbi:MAG: bifunctional alpha/beta hydrolase/OsmC family protein [Pseudomonadota bacterium]